MGWWYDWWLIQPDGNRWIHHGISSTRWQTQFFNTLIEMIAHPPPIMDMVDCLLQDDRAMLSTGPYIYTILWMEPLQNYFIQKRGSEQYGTWLRLIEPPIYQYLSQSFISGVNTLKNKTLLAFLRFTPSLPFLPNNVPANWIHSLWWCPPAGMGAPISIQGCSLLWQGNHTIPDQTMW